MGVGIGAGAGAAAALMGVLLSRGPEAVLAKGTTVEMVIDRALIFDENEIENWMARGRAIGEGPGPDRAANNSPCRCPAAAAASLIHYRRPASARQVPVNHCSRPDADGDKSRADRRLLQQNFADSE